MNQREIFLASAIRHIVFLIFTAAVLFGCGTPRPDATIKPIPKESYVIDGVCYYPLDCADGFRQKGVASWYGPQFHEKKTANGEVYNMYAMTAAHKTLPFGTMVRVTNTENGKSTIVRINDRGPFCRGRIIDLSYSAAKALDMIKNGTATVEITALGRDNELMKASGKGDTEKQYFTGDFTIQAGSFGDPANAEKLKKSIETITADVSVTPFEKNGKTFYRVRVGRFRSLNQAKQMEQHLIQNGFSNVYTVAWDL